MTSYPLRRARRTEATARRRRMTETRADGGRTAAAARWSTVMMSDRIFCRQLLQPLTAAAAAAALGV